MSIQSIKTVLRKPAQRNPEEDSLYVHPDG